MYENNIVKVSTDDKRELMMVPKRTVVSVMSLVEHEQTRIIAKDLIKSQILLEDWMMQNKQELSPRGQTTGRETEKVIARDIGIYVKRGKKEIVCDNSTA